MIIKFQLNILFLISLCLIFGNGLAQEPEPGPEHTVHRSKEKIILEGKVYYIHFVAKKETLYGISRAYNVTEKVIASENPDVFAGLQAGMVLKIPAEPVMDESLEIKDTEEYIFHVLKEEETLYFLSKKYGIDVVEIEKANPEITVSNLQVNQVLKIPRRKSPKKERDFPADSFVYHFVKAGETLYSLMVLYDVSIEEIKEMNPELRWGDLKSDEYIKIPRRSDVASEQILLISPTDSLYAAEVLMIADSLPPDHFYSDSLMSQMDTLTEIVEEPGIPFWSTLKMRRIRPEPIRGEIKVAMLLPLDLHWDEVTDTMEIVEGEEGEILPEKVEDADKNIVNPRVVGYLEFYEGVLMALDSLKKEGHSVTLFTYDTQRDRGRTMEILRKPEMRNVDLIIGPVNYWNLEIVSDFARDNRIPLVSPFSPRKELVYYNPWIFQLTPTYEVEFRAWAEYLSDYYTKTMILVHNGDSTEYHRIQFLKNELFRRISEKADLEDLVFKEVIINDSVYVDMGQVLNAEQENLVIVPSDNEAYVSNVVSPLYYKLPEYDIQVSGMPQWNRFRNIDLIYFHNLNISYFTSFYVDYQKPEMLRFIDSFYRIYRTEPYRILPRGYNLGVYGYDIMFTFVKGLEEYGENLIYFGEDIQNDPILGPYKFKRISDYGGHVNSYITVVKFDPRLNIHKVELDERPEQIYRYKRSSRSEQ